MKKTITPRAPRAFTLVELLVTIAIIAILAALGMTAYRSVMAAANGAKCTSNLRTVGQAITLYVEDSSFLKFTNGTANPTQGQLPGPLNVGQIPICSKNYQSMLGFLLYPYLGLPEPTKVDLVVAVLQCPGWKKEVKKKDGVSYLATNSFTYENTVYRPFGYPFASGAMKMTAMPIQPSRIVVLKDADQMCPEAGGDWLSNLPAKPVHNGKRNTLYLDGHVSMQ